MTSETAENGNDFQSTLRALPDPVLDDADARVVCFQTGERVETALKMPTSEPTKIETKPAPTRPRTYLDTVLDKYQWKLNAFYKINGEPKSDHEKIEVLTAFLNVPRNLDLGNLELRLLWAEEALSETESSYFV